MNENYLFHLRESKVCSVVRGLDRSQDCRKIFQMLLWAFLLLAGASEVARASRNGTNNSRVKRQFEADRCDPSYCQIPVSDQMIFWLPNTFDCLSSLPSIENTDNT